MSLTVLSVAYPFAPVGPDSVGGSEQVLSILEARLVQAGCRSIVLASRGSRVGGILHPLPDLPATIDDDHRAAVWDICRTTIARIVDEARVDLVHMHGLDFAHYLPPQPIPTIVTLHLPLGWYPPDLLALLARNVRFVCVSRSQRERGGRGFGAVPVVDNGVPVHGAPRFRKRGFALALGRVCLEKGFHDAVLAARKADAALGIAGRVFPYAAHRAYFRRQLGPLLDGRRRFLGPIAGRRKRRLLGSAGCLIVPSLVEETSSMVALEALAAGTPVVARRIGALPEIVEDGRTGFLVGGVDEMAEAIARCRDLDPDECRAVARARFTARRMVEGYLSVYRDALGA